MFLDILKPFLPVTAAKWLRPHLILVTATDGLNSVSPNSVEGIFSGTEDSDKFGPFPRMPYPQTNTSPFSEKDADTQIYADMVKQKLWILVNKLDSSINGLNNENKKTQSRQLCEVIHT